MTRREPGRQRGDRVGRVEGFPRFPQCRDDTVQRRPDRRRRCRRTSPRSARAGSRRPGCRRGTTRRPGRRASGSAAAAARAVASRWGTWLMVATARSCSSAVVGTTRAPSPMTSSARSSQSVSEVLPGSKHSTQAQPWKEFGVGGGEAGGLPAGHRVAADEARQALVPPLQPLLDQHPHRGLDRGDVGDQPGVAGGGELVEHPRHRRQRHRDDARAPAAATVSRIVPVTCQRASAVRGRRPCGRWPGWPGRRRSRAPDARRRRGRAAPSHR